MRGNFLSVKCMLGYRFFLHSPQNEQNYRMVTNRGVHVFWGNKSIFQI